MHILFNIVAFVFGVCAGIEIAIAWNKQRDTTERHALWIAENRVHELELEVGAMRAQMTNWLQTQPKKADILRDAHGILENSEWIFQASTPGS